MRGIVCIPTSGCCCAVLELTSARCCARQVISDELNHASIIDGIRLCKAQRQRYKHMDMADLEENLKKAQGCRQRMIVTDGTCRTDSSVSGAL